MKKVSKGRFIVSSALIILLIGSKFKMDKDIDSLNNKVIQWGTTVEDNDIHFIAHRGYSSAHPDNSLEAIQSCSELKCVEGIECDVRLTKDNKLVLFHNEYVGLKHVYEYTYDELCQKDLKSTVTAKPILFCGYNGKEIAIISRRQEFLREMDFCLPTFESMLKTRDKSKKLFIDIKFSGYNDDYLMTKIGELLHGEDNIIIQSFDENKLREMKELYPEYKYQLLIETKKSLDSIDYDFDAYGIKFTVLEDRVVENLISHDKTVSLWTVNSYEDFNMLLEQYSSYKDDMFYISDNPDILGYQYSKDK